MSKFDEIMKHEEYNVSGSFDCHYCDDTATFAYYDIEDQELKYTCVNGHKSVIKGIKF